MRTALLLVVAAGCGGPAPGPSALRPDPNVPAEKPSDRPIPIPGGDTFEDPVYKNWAAFKPGTAVTQKTTTANEETKQATVTTIAYTLKERTDEFVVVDFVASTTHWDGRSEANPPQTLKSWKTYMLPKGARAETPVDPAPRGEEKVNVLGREYASTWRRTKGGSDGGEIITTTWSSDRMPGGLVKSESLIPSKKGRITIEVTDLRLAE